MRKKIAVFPGSFDPITIGHEELIYRALPLFDKVIVALGTNTTKQYVFSHAHRLRWLNMTFKDVSGVEIDQFEGLTVNYCKEIGAQFLIRGLRNASDFDYEKTISQLNSIIGEGVDTVFFMSQPKYSHISSTIVREIIIGKGDARPFLPQKIRDEVIDIAIHGQ